MRNRVAGPGVGARGTDGCHFPTGRPPVPTLLKHSRVFPQLSATAPAGRCWNWWQPACNQACTYVAPNGCLESGRLEDSITCMCNVDLLPGPFLAAGQMVLVVGRLRRSMLEVGCCLHLLPPEYARLALVTFGTPRVESWDTLGWAAPTEAGLPSSQRP
jgi:hypothetical protein